jgi:hypothetical protein
MNRLAVVTGATGGIGLQLCRLLAKDGYDLVITGRSEEKLKLLANELKALQSIEVVFLEGDLSSAEFRDKLFGMTPGVPDVLINNAGFGDYGPFLESDWEKQDEMIKVNVLALTHLTHLYLPGMVGRGHGRILNVASVASFQPGPLMSVYYATKGYVLSFSEALSVELAKTGVTVTALCPGPVNTGFAKAANAESINVFKESSGADAELVARYGYRMMLKGKPVAVHGKKFKVLIFFERILPRSAVRKMLYRIQGSRRK